MRPRIICHMTSSIDGRLLVGRWTPPAAGIDRVRLRGYYEEVAARLGGEGWIVGRKTMAEMVKGGAAPAAPTPGALPRETFIARRRGRSLAVAIDPHGRLRYGEDNLGVDHVVAVLGEQVSDHYLAELRDVGVSYLFAGFEGTELGRAMDTFGGAFGVRRILLEGGGTINGSFLKAGLIDEISLLVYPGIDGLASAPSIFEFAGAADEKPAAGRALRHLGTETLEGGMVWLRYAVESASA